ncbi:MAG: hypothetical protein ACOX9R_03625 [Armatimonadota bacterium]
MFWRSSRLHCLVAVIVVTLMGGVCGAWAQGYGAPVDGMGNTSYGTPNMQPAEPWAGDSPLVWGEVRTWKADNWTWAAGARAGVGNDMDAELTFFHMDTSGEDPIAGVVRDSEATLVGLNFKWVAHRGEKLLVSVIPGAEFPIGDTKGRNPALPATAVSDEIIPVISVPVEYTCPRGTLVRVTPRYIGFDASPELADGSTIDGFGNVLALAFGATHDFGQYSAMADGAVVISKYNSINKNTNRPTDEFVWSVGGSWHPTDRPVRVDLFVTNAAGPTAASSIIATPDQSIGVGLRVSGEF